MFVTFGICYKQHFDTRYLVFYNPSPPRMFLSLDLLSEYRIQHGAIGPLYVTSSYSARIFCRGVSGFATDCHGGVWGLTTRSTFWKSNFTRGQFWPSGIVVACVCLSVCPSVRPSVCVCGKHLFVSAITHQPFKPGSPNLDHRCKRPWLRSLLFWGVIDPDLQGQIQRQSQKVPHFELVGTITHHLFKLGSQNFGQRCKIPGLRFLSILVLIGLDLQFHFQFWNPFFYQTYSRCFCKYLVRPSPVYI